MLVQALPKQLVNYGTLIKVQYKHDIQMLLPYQGTKRYRLLRTAEHGAGNLS